jgi:hypothetical protein
MYIWIKSSGWSCSVVLKLYPQATESKQLDAAGVVLYMIDLFKPS